MDGELKNHPKDCIVKVGLKTVIYRQSFRLQHRWTDTQARIHRAKSESRSEGESRSKV